MILISRVSQWVVLAGLGMIISLMAGCGQQPAANAPGRVAVVDINRIALATGFDHQISQKLQEVQHEEQSRLLTLQKQLGLDKPPSKAPETQAEAQKLAESEQQFRTAVDQAQHRLDALRTAELQKFRNAIRPIAEHIANVQGCSIVMEQRGELLSVDPTSDITDQVIAQMPKVDQNQASGSLPGSSMMPPTILPPSQQGLGTPPAPAPAPATQPAVRKDHEPSAVVPAPRP